MRVEQDTKIIADGTVLACSVAIDTRASGSRFLAGLPLAVISESGKFSRQRVEAVE